MDTFFNWWNVIISVNNTFIWIYTTGKTILGFAVIYLFSNKIFYIMLVPVFANFCKCRPLFIYIFCWTAGYLERLLLQIGTNLIEIKYLFEIRQHEVLGIHSFGSVLSNCNSWNRNLIDDFSSPTCSKLWLIISSV